MKVGVTGGAGFIGGWVVDELVARGHEPVIFDQRGRPSLHEVILGDVRDATAVMGLAQRVDGIIHLAAVLGTQETIEAPRAAVEVNVGGGLNVLEACRFAKVPLVNICVGNWWMRNTYSTTKHTVERLLEQYVAHLNLSGANVRAVNAYGPRQGAAPPFAPGKVRKIMPAFICRALSGMPIEIYGDGLQVSDCVYVADVARVLVSTLEHVGTGRSFSIPIEVGSTDPVTVAQVAKHVTIAADVYTGEDLPIVHLPMRPGEAEGGKVTADVSTLSLIGEDATKFLPLDEGVARTVAWFHDNEGVTWRCP